MKILACLLSLNLITASAYGELTPMDMDVIRANYRANQVKIVSDALRGADSLKMWPPELDGLAEVMEMETSDSLNFRWDICAEVYKQANEIDGETEKKRELVYLLTTRLNDRSTSIQGSVLKWLRDFNASCFNEFAMQNIKDKFDAIMDRDTILLMEVIDPAYCMSKTNHLVDNFKIDEEAPGRFWGRSAWTALLVHARHGNAKCIDEVINGVSYEHNESVRVKRLFADLGYVRQPKSVEYLKSQIFENRVVPGGRDYSPISYAQEACNILSTVLKGFPKKSGDKFDLYTATEIERIKDWLSQQQKWEFVE